MIRLLTPFDRLELAGSAGLGLKVWPDIDINVLCIDSDPDRIWPAVGPLASHPCVRILRWANERGPFNSTGLWQDEGYYLRIHFLDDGSKDGERWKVDCWFLPSDSPRPEFALIDRLQRPQHRHLRRRARPQRPLTGRIRLLAAGPASRVRRSACGSRGRGDLL